MKYFVKVGDKDCVDLSQVKHFWLDDGCITIFFDDDSDARIEFKNEIEASVEFKKLLAVVNLMNSRYAQHETYTPPSTYKTYENRDPVKMDYRIGDKS